jgi:RHS repeat-associated protein
VPLRVPVTLAFLLLLFWVPSSSAQSSIPSLAGITNDTAPPVPGAGHDYIHLLTETVNPANGSVSISISLPVPKGRGLTLPYAINYNSGASGHWIGANGFIGALIPGGGGGWGTTLPVLSVSANSLQYPYGDGLPGSPSEYCYFTTGYAFQDSLGQSHALGLAAASLPPFTNANCTAMGSNIPTFNVVNSGQDSQVQGMFLASCALNGGGIGPPPNTNCEYATPPVAVADGKGTIYSFQPSGAPAPGITVALATWPTQIEDRNGNLIKIQMSGTGLTVTDTAGRPLITTNGSYQGSPTEITVGGLTYTIAYTTTSVTYAPQFSGLAAPDGAPPENVNCNQGIMSGSLAPTVIKSITLPNGRQYVFTYDSTYGVVDKISFPDGGWVAYSWKLSDTYSDNDLYSGTQTNGPPVPVSCNYIYKTPVVGTRTVGFTSSSTPNLTQTFSYITDWSPALQTNYEWTGKTTTVLTTDNVKNLTSKTIYKYSSVPTGQPGYPGFQGSVSVAGQQAVEQEVDFYDWGQTNLLKTTLKDWFDQFELMDVTTEFPSASGSVAKTSYTYQFGGAILSKTESDFGSGSSGLVLRKTVNTFQPFGGNPLFKLGSNAAVQTLYSFPCKSVVTNTVGTRTAETDILYDGGTVLCGTAGTAATTAVTVIPATHDDTNFAPGSSTPRGNATTVTRLCLTSCANAVTTYSYLKTGQVSTMIDPCGNATCTDMVGTDHTTAYYYTDSYTIGSPSGNTNAYLTEIKRPATSASNHLSYYSYSWLDGQLTESKDENSQPTYYTYSDTLGRLTETSYPDGGSVSYYYNDATPSVQTTTTASPNPSIVSLSTRDGMGHTIQTETTSLSSPIYTTTTYDGLGNVYTISNPHYSSSGPTDGVLKYAIDAIGRTTSITEQDGSIVSTSFSGNTATKTDEAGRQQKAETDALGRLEEVWESPSGYNYPTTYGHDTLGDLTGVTENGSRNRTYVFDSLGRITSSTNPESGTTSFAYDVNGNIRTRTDARSIVTTYNYDALNREIQRSYSDGTPLVSYLYDTASTNGVTIANPIGRVSRASTPTVESLYSYDALGRIITHWQTTPEHNSIAFALVYTYDLAGKLGTFNNSFGATFTYKNDAAGRIVSLQSSLSALRQYPANIATVDPSIGYYPTGGLRKITYGNNLVETAAYNGRLQPCRLNLNNSATALGTCTDAVPSNSDEDFTYGFSYGSQDNGNLINWAGVGQQVFSRTYGYDQLNRLSTLSDTGAAQACKGLSWVYDAWGNRTAQNVTSGSCVAPQTPVNTNNQISTAGYTFDASGNMTADGIHTYSYDAEGRLTKVDGGSTATYAYDADGQRVEKLTGVTYVDYVYDLSGNVVADWNGSPTAQYIYMGGNLIAEYQASTTHFIFKDHLGSTRLVTAMDDSVVDSIDYLPYGEQIAGGSGSSHKFTSKERDAETTLDNFVARYMASRFGRFMSPDPKPIGLKLLANPQDLNEYDYTVNNPLRYYDPNGKDWATAWQDVKTFVSSIDVKLSAGIGFKAKLEGGGYKAEGGVSAKVNSTMSLGGATIVKNSISGDVGGEVEDKKAGIKAGEQISAEKVMNSRSSDGTFNGPEPLEITKTDSLGKMGGTTVSKSSDDRSAVGTEIGDEALAGVEVSASKEGIAALGDAVTQVKNEIFLPTPPPPTPPPPPQPATCAPNSACP